MYGRLIRFAYESRCFFYCFFKWRIHLDRRLFFIVHVRLLLKLSRADDRHEFILFVSQLFEKKIKIYRESLQPGLTPNIYTLASPIGGYFGIHELAKILAYFNWQFRKSLFLYFDWNCKYEGLLHHPFLLQLVLELLGHHFWTF